MPLGAFKAALMGTAGASTGDVVLLSSQTADDDSSINFTSGIDSTYGEYIFKFYNIIGATNNKDFRFQVNASGESGYNETMTTAFIHVVVNEDGDNESLAYNTAVDQADGTAKQALMYEVSAAGTHSDGGGAGELHLFNPSSTTYVTHFYSRCQTMNGDGTPYAHDDFCAGYINTTAAITGVTFEMESGNITAGKIKMWGVK